MSDLREETIKSTPIFEGRVIRVQLDEVRLPNGETATREIVKHAGAVAVLAITEGQLLLVEQFRKPLERLLLEIPAGKLDPGEQPFDAAGRELQEETGYIATNLRPLYAFYTSPGFADEIIHLYVADQLTKGEQHLDDDEFLNVRKLTLDQAKACIETGEIRDAKTITAILAWELAERTGNAL